MRCLSLATVILALGMILVGCGSSGISSSASYNPGYGPFDKNGNYIEAWADKPAKKHSWARSTPKPEPKPKAKAEPKLASNDPPKPSRSASRSRSTASRSTASRPPEPKSASRPSASKPKPKPVASTPPAPKPKPKPKPVKPKKPAPLKYTVKKGDTLYGLSRRHGTSVSSIQRANGLSGTTIRIGRTLLIPR